MKKSTKLSLVMFAYIIVVALLSLFFYRMASGEEELTGTLNIDFSNETAIYTESYASSTMSTSVEPNLCNTCIRLFRPSQCLEACDVIFN